MQFIYPMLDPSTRTLRVRLEFANRTGCACGPGCTATSYLKLPAHDGLMVPREAVVDTGETQYVFVRSPTAVTSSRAS